MVEVGGSTYRNVPPEKRSSMPVHQWSPSTLEPPNKVMMSHVMMAPKGAARLKTMRWPLAARFDRPCFRRREVRPKEAGALWIMMATKMMKPSFMSVVVDE